ncbi:MAG: imidazole glycerol phosphate synthase subunit HisH [Clostridia bacterium]|nr:imidazole glycerol phosphate synthase subunit HisH [Clostridia bacterium]
MIAIIDYGVGNLFSLHSSFLKIGAETVVTSDPNVIKSADRVILPGVGAYGEAAEKIKNAGLDRVVREIASDGKPLLGICLGMQLLFEYGTEFGKNAGLGLLKGHVVSMRNEIAPTLKLPQIGWNALNIMRKNKLFKYINNGDHVYFVHSFHAVDCDESLIATTEYGAEITAAVANDNVFGCQFHPEKSGEIGLNILKGFLD